MSEHRRRALAAYFQHPGGAVLDPPAALEVEEIVVAGKAYVVLGDGAHILAVYRVRPSGLLRRLRRWPQAVTATTPIGATASPCQPRD